MSSCVDIGPARLDEAAQIARMSRWLIEHGFRWSWTPARVAHAIRGRDDEVAVAREDRVIGFAAMRYGLDVAHLLLLGVHPRHQQRGIGKRLLGWLEAMTRVGGVEAVQLEVRASNLAARRFYRASGYVERQVVRRYYSGVEDGVIMMRDLG